MPSSGPARQAQAQPVVDGEVPEGLRHFEATVESVVVAGSYRYLDLRLEGGDRRWAVIAAGAPAVGERVAVDAFGLETNFHSHRLDREFDELLFAALAQPPSPGAQP
ncbi:hypothetical protein [Plesiocystis pacifica]|uniref:hypothetical protein n=1 Tax=Plesiocystis pacifica TaxID=191768 RepID=UPI0012F7D9A4|nr:hypothetical protein [Plesiocystis pacifica]